MTKGTNPHSSAIGDDYDSYLQQQIATEWAEWDASKRAVPAVGAAAGTVPPPRAQKTLQDVKFNFEDVHVKTRRFAFNWKFSLNEAAGNPEVTVKQIQRSDWSSFQMKPVGSENNPDFDQKREGDLNHVIFKRIKVVQVHTNSPEAMCLTMSGIKGRTYGINTGIRTPFMLNPESNAYEISSVIHELDESLMKMADLKYTKMSKEYLDRQTVPLPGKPGMCAVAVDSDITEVIAQQESKYIPKLSEIPVFGNGSHFVLNTKLGEKCKQMLLEKRGNIKLQTTDIFDMKVGLMRADGLAWNNTDVAMALSAQTGLVGQELLDYIINTNLVVECEFFNVGGENWNRGVVAPTPK